MANVNEELRSALVELLDAFGSFMNEANLGASVLTAETIRKMNEAPIQAQWALADAARADKEQEEGTKKVDPGQRNYMMAITHKFCLTDTELLAAYEDECRKRAEGSSGSWSRHWKSEAGWAREQLDGED